MWYVLKLLLVLLHNNPLLAMHQSVHALCKSSLLTVFPAFYLFSVEDKGHE